MDSVEEKYGTRLRMTLCFCSSEDDVYTAANLQTQIRTTCGWQSKKNCEYPQELGFYFDGQVSLNCVRFLAHESKIPSSVDVLVADATSDEVEKGVAIAYEDAVFTRLGHIRFSMNEENHFAARELKTIGIRRRCVYLKFLFSSPYTNGYNLFQQVGVVGLAAYGTLTRTLTLWSSRRLALPVAAVIEVSLDEMIPFYRHHDEEARPSSPDNFSNAVTTERLKELRKLKHKAIAEEDFDLAAALKEKIDLVKEAGKEIDELMELKKKAIQEENYGEAKRIKQRIDALRSAGYYLTVPVGSESGPGGDEGAVRRVQHKVVLTTSEFDKTKAVGKGFYDLENDKSGGIINTEKVVSGNTVPIEGLGEPWELEVNRIIQNQDPNAGLPETLSEKLAAEGKFYESDLGVYAVACLLSRSSALREAGVNALFSAECIRVLREHSETWIQTLLTYLVSKGRGVNDPVANVSTAACDYIISIVNGNVPHAVLSQLTLFMSKALQNCVDQLSESNSRVRKGFMDVVLALAQSSFGCEKVIASLLVVAKKKNGFTSNFRYHVGRVELLSNLADIHGVEENSPIQIEDLFNVVIVPLLQHPHKEVRDACMRLMVKLFKMDNSNRCAAFLKDIKQAQIDILEAELKGDGRALPVANPEGEAEPPSANRRGSRSRSVSQEISNSKLGTPRLPTSSSRNPQSRRGSRRLSSGAALPQRPPAEDDGLVSSRTCQFCREFKEDFTEINLDIHYIRSCPMLCPCPLCEQITEIATLQQHLVTECEGHDLVRECPRCREAVRAEDLKKHVDAQACIEYVPTHSVCPLCHSRFRSGMEGWRKHLTTPPGCVNNPRKYDGTGPIM